MLTEKVERKTVFDTEQIKTGDAVIFKKDVNRTGKAFSSSVPVRVGIIQRLYEETMEIVYLEKGEKVINFTRITTDDIASGQAKLKVIKLDEEGL